MGARLPGSNNPNAIFSEADVRAIREEWAAGNSTCKAIAERYGCSRRAIYGVVRGETYRDAGFQRADNKQRATKKGERHPLHRLTEAQVIEIKRALREGAPRKVLAERFRVTPPHIGAIERGKFWRHVKP